jgi:ribosomal protein S27E
MASETVTCGICGRPRERDDADIITLTPEERKIIGPNAPVEVVKCKPCQRLMLNPEAALQVMKGLAQIGLQQLGVNVGAADKATEKYRNDLLPKMKILRKP